MSVDEVLEKIKKIMRLANKAGTDGERAAAEAAAQRLADMHGIDLSHLTVTEGDTKAVQKDSEKAYMRSGVENSFISHVLRKHFGVVVMMNYRVGQSTMRLTFFGVNLNIEIAKWVYDILYRESRKAWAKERGWGLKKKTWMTGWFMQIDRKLTEHPLRNDLDQFQAEKDAAERKFKEYCSNNQGVKEQTTKGDRSDKEALYRGYMAADKVQLNRPCEGRETPSPFALGLTKQLKGGL